MKFCEMNLCEQLLTSIGRLGYQDPTPIQTMAIPYAMEGKDILGSAQTGTGKTAAFALPILHQLKNATAKSPGRHIRALILAPTRELAAQITESFSDYGRGTGLKCGVIYGGVSQFSQTRMLQSGVDILVATPGRLLDLHSQKLLNLSKVEIFVLDEADRMLDMGFINDIRRVSGMLPLQRQTLMFSATMPSAIKNLAASLLKNPQYISVARESEPVDLIQQSVVLVEKPDKINLLLHLLSGADVKSALVFSKTRHGADKVARSLCRAGILASAIHGDKSQAQREKTLDSFRRGKTRVLVATDLASRGLDIDELSHVVNFDLPMEPESYVHRIGRTGRAGAAGMAISLCAMEERTLLRDIERKIGRAVKVDSEQPFQSPFPLLVPRPAQSRGRNRSFGTRSFRPPR